MKAVDLGSGSIFRLAFGPSIRKNKWYIGVKCHGCQKPILVLEDVSSGTVSPVFVGESKLSIPCRFCGLDDLYAGGEMMAFQAKKSIPSFRERRPKPSGSPRQPFLPRYKNANVTFGVGALEQRPDAALVVARCIAYWTNVECTTARLLSTILHANTQPTIALYLSLQNARAKRDAMYAAAETTLETHDYELFQAIMNFKGSVEKERNALAHGVFGISESVKDGVIWVDTTRYAQYEAQMRISGLTERFQNDRKSHYYVYKTGDLETIARDIEDLDENIGSFAGYLRADDMKFRAARYPQLCAHPRIHKELDQIRQKSHRANAD